MKYLFSTMLIISINSLLFAQNINNEPPSENEIGLNQWSEIGSKNIENLNILIDSIKVFKNKQDQKLFSEADYNQQRTKLKNKYVEEAKSAQKYYGILVKHLETFPVDLKNKIKGIKINIDNILPNGEIPDDIKTNLGYLIPISDYYKSTLSIDKTISQIKTEKKKGKNNIYNVSETALNDFGYELINSQKVNEAVEIFILNTKLYPQGYNTFDSLGECLLLLNRKKEAIKSYQKSLELNPNNENAKKIINKIK